MHDRHGNPTRASLNGAAGSDDFLGLDDELRRRVARGEHAASSAPMPPAPLPGHQTTLRPRVPQQEMLAPAESLSANWPEVRPNVWRPLNADAPSAAPQHVPPQHAQSFVPAYAPQPAPQVPPYYPQQVSQQVPQQPAPQYTPQYTPQYAQPYPQPPVQPHVSYPQQLAPQYTPQYQQPYPQLPVQSHVPYPQHDAPQFAQQYAQPTAPPYAPTYVQQPQQYAQQYAQPYAQPYAPQPARQHVQPHAPERPSWLLALDDRAVPPAHPSFVPTRAPSNASFRDEPTAAHRVAPWAVRGACIVAGLFVCALVTRSLLAGAAHPKSTASAPARLEPPPVARATPPARLELASPGDDAARGKHGAKRPLPAAPRTAPSEPESPALLVVPLPGADAPEPRPDGGAAFDRDRVDQWLAAKSGSATPLSDAGAIVAPEPPPAGAAPTSAGASGIWEGATIPVEALQGGLRVETPAVGRVRARLDDGTRAEGRLLAIGQGRVWIETDQGPLVLERDRLRGLEQIAERDAPSAAPQPPRRQRVRTAGGVFFGRVLARDGRTVTLITDAGARLTVEADEISDADPSEKAPGTTRRDR